MEEAEQEIKNIKETNKVEITENDNTSGPNDLSSS